MEALTERQQQILDFIVKTVKSRGYPPTIREICEAVGLSSSNTVQSHLISLEDKGRIKRGPGPRAITIIDGIVA